MPIAAWVRLITQVGTAAGIEVDAKAEEAAQVEQIWQGLNRLSGPSLLILDKLPGKRAISTVLADDRTSSYVDYNSPAGPRLPFPSVEHAIHEAPANFGSAGIEPPAPEFSSRMPSSVDSMFNRTEGKSRSRRRVVINV